MAGIWDFQVEHKYISFDFFQALREYDACKSAHMLIFVHDVIAYLKWAGDWLPCSQLRDCEWEWYVHGVEACSLDKLRLILEKFSDMR